MRSTVSELIYVSIFIILGVLGTVNFFLWSDVFLNTDDDLNRNGSIGLLGYRTIATDKNEAKIYGYNREPTGDFVCVNVKNMEYEKALEVCSHEVGHEIFAEECEKNATICFDAIRLIKGADK